VLLCTLDPDLGGSSSQAALVGLPVRREAFQQLFGFGHDPRDELGTAGQVVDQPR
jgi:hypothetical protein